MTRIVFCRPRGGLNDTLTQVELSWRYAEHSGRQLVVDTNTTFALGLCVRFGQYFEPLHNLGIAHFDPSQDLIERLTKLSCYPPEIQGRLGKYALVFDQRKKSLIETVSGKVLSFDHKKPYTESVLVTDRSGGSPISIFCLARMKLTEQFRNILVERLAPLLNKEYVAVSVRNTDYKSDFQEFFNKLITKLSDKRVLICSDSQEVISHAKNVLVNSEVIVLDRKFDTKGVAHPKYATTASKTLRHELMVSTVADLLGIAMCNEHFYCKISNQVAGYSGIGGYSGFAILAENLRRNPKLVTQLLYS